MAEFIFTEEGRTGMVSQEGGIRLAVIGGVFIQGIMPGDEMWENCDKITFKSLIENPNVVIGMKGVEYRSNGTGGVTPKYKSAYEYALGKLDNYVFPALYMPASQIVGNNNGATYGSYRIEYDSASLTWDKEEDVDKFLMFVLIGKQYAETDDATFNVNRLQEPVVVGVAKINKGEKSEAVFLTNQNDFVTFNLDLVFTLTDEDNDKIEFDSDDVVEDYSKLDLVNNGLKTVGLNIVDGEDDPATALESLGLNPAGGFATKRSLMVAAAAGANDVENQWNAAGLVHIANKNEDGNYRKQLILSTFKTDNDSIESHHVGINLDCGIDQLLGTGDVIRIGRKFNIGPIDAADHIALDIFGIDNTFYDDCSDCAIGTQNITSHGGNRNLILGSSNTKFNADAWNNIIVGDISSLINASANRNVCIGTQKAWIAEGKGYNIIIGGSDCSGTGGMNAFINTKSAWVGGTYGTSVSGAAIIGGLGLKAVAADQIVLGKYNSEIGQSGAIIYGNGTGDDYRSNAFEIYPDTHEFTFGDLSYDIVNSEHVLNLNHGHLSANEISGINVRTSFGTMGYATIGTLFVKDATIRATSGIGYTTENNKSWFVGITDNSVSPAFNAETSTSSGKYTSNGITGTYHARSDTSGSFRARYSDSVLGLTTSRKTNSVSGTSGVLLNCIISPQSLGDSEPTMQAFPSIISVVSGNKNVAGDRIDITPNNIQFYTLNNNNNNNWEWKQVGSIDSTNVVNLTKKSKAVVNLYYNWELAYPYKISQIQIDAPDSIRDNLAKLFAVPPILWKNNDDEWTLSVDNTLRVLGINDTGKNVYNYFIANYGNGSNFSYVDIISDSRSNNQFKYLTDLKPFAPYISEIEVNVFTSRPNGQANHEAYFCWVPYFNFSPNSMEPVSTDTINVTVNFLVNTVANLRLNYWHTADYKTYTSTAFKQFDTIDRINTGSILTLKCFPRDAISNSEKVYPLVYAPTWWKV